MAGSLDMVTSSIGSALDFAMKNFRELLIQMSKIYLLSFAVMLVTVIALAAVFFLAGGVSIFGGGSAVALLAPMLVLGLGIMFVFIVVCESIGIVRFAAVEAVQGRTHAHVIEKASGALMPVAGYMLAMLVAAGIVLGIPVAAALLLLSASGSQSALTWLGVAVLVGLGIVAWIIVALLVQFSLIDIMINKSGAMEAIRRSVALVRRNLAAVIIYDIALFILSFAIGIVFGIINELLSFGLTLGAFNIALLMVFLAVYFVAVLAESVLINTVLSPVEYFFWKAIGGKR